ncbi:MCP four helix bundle domain-containing protein [Massilia sp. IC2-477]|uniref:MCP four helix bundle domain-containing protein n=1 Tax=Massilia sp. IC2-477 TaxID=2887198 RepID=UPI001D12B20C|nr:methyl-accepting chemotaxis protein [Massilia sp. IC2-477]MCC2957157.1 MCP four helix bundle domain-containing protein [Massilia sp. IC2-477]
MTTKPLSTGARLAIGYGAVILLMIALAVLAAARAGQIEHLLFRIDDVSGIKQRYAFELRASVRDRSIAMRDLVLASDPAAAVTPIARLKTSADAYARAASPLDALFHELPGILPEERDALAAIKEQERRTRPLVERVLALHTLGETQEARALLASQAAPAFVDWLASVSRFVDLQEKLAADDMANARRLASGFGQWIVLLCAGAVAAAVFGTWYVVRGLRPAPTAAPDEAPVQDVAAAPAAIPPKRVDDIVGAIDGLAFRANILALDAAVHALRTGEQDEDSSAVVQELQALALRSTAVVKDIRDLVGSPVAHMEDAGALQAIANAVSRVTAVTSAISLVEGPPPDRSESTRRTTALLQASSAAAAMEAEAQRLAAIVAPALHGLEPTPSVQN